MISGSSVILLQHLQDARRHALSAGLRWFWAISQLAILYLLARFYMYQDVRQVAIAGLPRGYLGV